MKMLPNSRPQITRAEVEQLVIKNGFAFAVGAITLVMIPGYYAKSMGATTGNDRGVYDDALVVLTPNVYATFNANTDPSTHRVKTHQKQGIATLKPGVHPYKRGNHGISKPGGGYPAFRPATKGERLPVFRDGDSDENAFGVAINIHKGGYNGTSSEGCQTVHPAQWAGFYALVDVEMKRCKVETFNLVKLAA